MPDAIVNPTGIGPGGGKETVSVATVSTAVTDTSGATATGIVDLKTGATNGSWVTEVDVNANTTVTDGAIYFFLYDGTNRTPFGDAVQVTARTVGDTVPPFTAVWRPPGGLLKIPPSWKLQGATRKGESFRLTVKGGDNPT